MLHKSRWIKLGAVVLVSIIGMGLLSSTLTVSAAGVEKGHKGLVKDIWSELVDAAKKVAGLTDQQIKDGIKDGKSLAEIIRAAGGSVDKVEVEAKTVVKDKIEQAVKDGNLTRKRADKLLEHLDAVMDRLMNHKGHHKGGKADATTATATATATATIPAAQ